MYFCYASIWKFVLDNRPITTYHDIPQTGLSIKPHRVIINVNERQNCIAIVLLCGMYASSFGGFVQGEEERKPLLSYGAISFLTEIVAPKLYIYKYLGM